MTIQLPMLNLFNEELPNDRLTYGQSIRPKMSLCNRRRMHSEYDLAHVSSMENVVPRFGFHVIYMFLSI